MLPLVVVKLIYLWRLYLLILTSSILLTSFKGQQSKILEIIKTHMEQSQPQGAKSKSDLIQTVKTLIEDFKRHNEQVKAQ